MGHPPANQPTGSTAKPPQSVRESQWSDTEPDDLSRLVSTLAAHGGGTISADLALDLVLNEVVKHACLVTGASAAAIALVREDEMVCRATTGAEAPDLGVRLDTRTGLSGACVLTREVQHCNDTESDPRVNLEVSRRLGVRSVLVVPLLNDKELVGIFEIFSPEANHFGDPDVLTVKSLANEVIQNLKKASGTTSEAQIGTRPARGRNAIAGERFLDNGSQCDGGCGGNSPRSAGRVAVGMAKSGATIEARQERLSQARGSAVRRRFKRYGIWRHESGASHEFGADVQCGNAARSHFRFRCAQDRDRDRGEKRGSTVGGGTGGVSEW